MLPPEFDVLLVGEVKSDLGGLALNHHVENLPVLGHLDPTGGRANSIKASSLLNLALQGSAVRIRSVSKKITFHAFQYRKEIRTL
jgi:hypothetical protein